MCNVRKLGPLVAFEKKEEVFNRFDIKCRKQNCIISKWFHFYLHWTKISWNKSSALYEHCAKCCNFRFMPGLLMQGLMCFDDIRAHPTIAINSPYTNLTLTVTYTSIYPRERAVPSQVILYAPLKSSLTQRNAHHSSSNGDASSSCPLLTYRAGKDLYPSSQ